MKLSKITIKNFKGISAAELDLSKSPHNNVYTLVGINESGKTTILEAINCFEYNDERDLNATQINFEDMIPIKEKTNFNGKIEIISQIAFNESDNRDLREYLDSTYQYRLSSDVKFATISQIYKYRNSKYEPENFLWSIALQVTKKGERAPRDLWSRNSDHWRDVTNYLKTKMPKILYFPTAFFDLPDRICLSTNTAAAKEETPKDKFLQLMVQDILDSLDNDLDIQTHIIDRIENGDHNLIESLSLDMGRKINDVILDEWKEILNDIQYEIEVKFTKDNTDKKIYLEFKVKAPDGYYKLSERSLGFRWFFMFLLLTQFRGFRKDEDRHIIFLFDEPAANLSSRAQKQLLKSLQNISDRCTIIYTTHSHHLVNPHWLEGAYVVSNDAFGDNEIESFNLRKTNIKLERYRSYVDSNPQNISYFQPILDVLEYVPNELDMVLPSVILEGKNDYFVLKYFFGLQLCKNDIPLIPGMSCTNVDSLISLFCSWGKKFIVLLDSDEEAKNSKNRYCEEFGKIVENRIFTLSDINPKWKKSLEDIIASAHRFAIQKIVFQDSKKYTKKMFNKAIQELLMKDEKISLDESIITNFNKIHTFLADKIKLNM